VLLEVGAESGSDEVPKPRALLALLGSELQLAVENEVPFTNSSVTSMPRSLATLLRQSPPAPDATGSPDSALPLK